MEMRNREIRQRWKDNGVMPGLRHRWLFDRRYWLDDLEEMDEIIAACRPKIEKYVDFRGEFADCDDHALMLVAEIRKAIIDKAIAGEYSPERMKPRVVGRVAGRMFRGIPTGHSLCVMEVKQGTYFFEGHEDRRWKENKDNDSVFFLSA